MTRLPRLVARPTLLKPTTKPRTPATPLVDRTSLRPQPPSILLITRWTLLVSRALPPVLPVLRTLRPTLITVVPTNLLEHLSPLPPLLAIVEAIVNLLRVIFMVLELNAPFELVKVPQILVNVLDLLMAMVDVIPTLILIVFVATVVPPHRVLATVATALGARTLIEIVLLSLVGATHASEQIRSQGQLLRSKLPSLPMVITNLPALLVIFSALSALLSRVVPRSLLQAKTGLTVIPLVNVVGVATFNKVNEVRFAATTPPSPTAQFLPPYSPSKPH